MGENLRIGDDVLIKDIKVFPWSSEKDLNESLLKHINEFMETVFGEKVKSATNKKYEIAGAIKLRTGQLLPVRGARIDLWVECESGRSYLLEIKNPVRANYETFKAIGQILGYSVKFPEATNLVIVSTAYDDGFLEVMDKYKLPIDFVLITDKRTFLLKRNKNG